MASTFHLGRDLHDSVEQARCGHAEELWSLWVCLAEEAAIHPACVGKYSLGYPEMKPQGGRFKSSLLRAPASRMRSDSAGLACRTRAANEPATGSIMLCP